MAAPELGDACLQVTYRFVILPFINRAILPRRGLLVRCGRKIQKYPFRLPEHMRVFSETTDPGMRDEDIVTGTVTLLFVVPMGTLGIVGLVAGLFGTSESPNRSYDERVGLVKIGLVLLAIATLVLVAMWWGLVLARRRLERQEEGHGLHQGEKQNESLAHGYRSVRDSLQPDCEKAQGQLLVYL